MATKRDQSVRRFSLYRSIKNIIELIGLYSGAVGVIVVMLMMLMTVTDIALRRLANRPLSFSYELTTMFLAVVAILLIAYTCSQRRQVSIDLFVSRLPLKLQNIFLAIGDLAGFILFGLVAWRSVIYALHTKDIGYVTGILRLPLYPFIFVVAFGAASACLSTLIKFLDHFKNEAQE